MSTLPINIESFGAKTQKVMAKNILACKVWYQNNIGVSCNHPCL